MIKLALMLVFLLTACPAFADQNGYFSPEAKGWYWHDPDKDPYDSKNDTDEDKTMRDPIQQMKALQLTVEQALDKAVLHPTKENIRNYIVIQNQLTENSQRFERYWKAVLLEHPELDYSLKHPTNNIAKQVEYDQEKLKEEQLIRELARKSGLFFFYHSTCPYCVRFAPIVKDFAETYGITVIAITTDGHSLPEFPHSYIDDGQAAKFHVTAEPALYVVNPYTQKAFPIAFGLISAADLKKRLLDLATHYAGDVR